MPMKLNSDAIGNFFTKLFVMTLGMIFLVPSAYKIYHYGVIRSQSDSVNGVITRAGVGAYMGCKPYVAYADHQGKTYEIKSEINFHWFFAPKKGERIEVLFLRNDPQMAIIDSFFHYIALPCLFLTIGAVMVIFTFSRI